jgi:hypothetical protein
MPTQHDQDAIDLFFSRREAINLILASASAGACAIGAPDDNEHRRELPVAKPRGTLTDPDLLTKFMPWEFVLTDAEMAVVTPLCDLIMPADERSPAASAVGVPDFINEWVSAPYEQNQNELALFRWGLEWLTATSNARFGRPFGQLSEAEQRSICEPIAFGPKAPEELRRQGKFFSRFRALTVGAFYTTPEGRDDLQFMGNVALGAYPEPPSEVLAHLGLTEND